MIRGNFRDWDRFLNDLIVYFVLAIISDGESHRAHQMQTWKHKIERINLPSLILARLKLIQCKKDVLNGAVFRFVSLTNY